MSLYLQPGPRMEWEQGGNFPVRLEVGQKSEPMVIARKPFRRFRMNRLHAIREALSWAADRLPMRGRGRTVIRGDAHGVA